METGELISAILGSGLLGILIKEFCEDRSRRKKDETEKKKTNEHQLEILHTRNHVLEESLATHRHLIINAPCLGPEQLPPYPSRKD